MLPTGDGPPPFPLKDTAPKGKYPRVYFFNTMHETLREMRFYRWRESVHKEGDREKTEGEDHAMDAMRYITIERPSPFRTRSIIPANSFMGWMNKFKKQRHSS